MFSGYAPRGPKNEESPFCRAYKPSPRINLGILLDDCRIISILSFNFEFVLRFSAFPVRALGRRHIFTYCTLP